MLENSGADQSIMTKKMTAGRTKAQTAKGKWTTQVPEELWSLSSEFGKIKSATSIRITTDGASLAVRWLGCLTFTSVGTSLMPGGVTKI